MSRPSMPVYLSGINEFRIECCSKLSGDDGSETAKDLLNNAAGEIYQGVQCNTSSPVTKDTSYSEVASLVLVEF